jgi:hypothetical protein
MAATQAEKDMLILVMRNTLADPKSVRDAQISRVIADASNDGELLTPFVMPG